MTNMHTKAKTSPSDNTEISANLVEIRGKKRPRWTTLATALRAVREEAAWPFEGARNFTEWLELNAEHFGMKSTMLNTCMWMGKYYLEDLTPKLIQWNIPAPPLDELPEHIGPELLADLRKISRAGFSDTERHYAERIMMGSVRCAELRQAWVSCRKAIKKPHARGRVPAANYEQRESTRMRAGVFEAEMLSAILMHRGLLMENGEIIEYKVLHDTQQLFPDVPMPDFILVRRHAAAGISLEAIETRLRMTPEAERSGGRCRNFFDRVWLALPQEVLKSYRNTSQAFSCFDGVLAVGDQRVTIWKDSAAKTCGDKVDVLMRRLLARLLW
ncbi:hypothetical protein LPW11_10710 [Geomonas sp. RF6]|uniref:hypothetical protein n=1 Tax=Geomonas sp. RF6 TaxID=2897342 RepID=UPI001E6294F5|nr:hypothetical protein [Geomonas sp. RF6]UFS72644.1 hypothetical protein LPW11_10710 [Geomonas sp. RF6]